MNKSKTVHVGIDVSKDAFNYHFSGKDGKCENSRKGWRKLAKEIPAGAAVGMEATGVYHVRLAAFLRSKGFPVFVYNPLRVKRHMQSLGLKAKTDKADARAICNYAKTEAAKACSWNPLPPKLARARAIVTVLAALSRLAAAARNVNHSVGYIAGRDKIILSAMSSVSETCGERRAELEKELRGLVSDAYPEKFRLLVSVPGIGAYTAAVMLVCAKGLEFENSAKLSSFVGLAPTNKESGTSVKGKGKIAKTGNPYLRGLLFMCAFTAVQCNAACAALYARLVAKGKAKPLAHAAVMHRLVKIAFGVVKSGEPCRIGRPA